LVVEIKDNVAALASWINSLEPSVIFIDGCPGAGKTHLLNVLAKAGVRGLDLDKFIVQDQKCFVDALRIAELKHAISINEEQQVVLAGVCARRVAEVLDLKSARYVYVVRVSEVGVDKFSVAHEDEQTDVLSAEVGLPPAGPLESEVIAYHRTYKPMSQADVIYRNTRPDILTG
jgi:hypothetical protein